jgi:hypothetical protein
MATFTFFNDFKEQVVKGVHQFSTHTFKWVLTNSAPSASNTLLSDITQISGVNGYTTGGDAVTIPVTETGGTATVGDATSDVTWTATGGSIGPFRYAVLYNDSATSPADALVGYLDYGSSITITAPNTFTIDASALGLFTVTG